MNCIEWIYFIVDVALMAGIMIWQIRKDFKK